METITKEHIDEIGDELAKDMISLGSRELTLANVICVFVVMRLSVCYILSKNRVDPAFLFE